MTTQLPPQKFRELTLQFLFSQDVHASDPHELCEFLMRELKVSRKHVQEACIKVEMILAARTQIDAAITEISTSYALDRIQSVERAILRLAVFELLVEKSIPHQIIIAEAKRLAKKFSTPDAVIFCQALLDALVKKHEICNQEA